MPKDEILSQIRKYLVSNQNGDEMSQVNTADLERGKLIQSKLNPGESLEYIYQIEEEGKISNVKICNAGSLGSDAYANNNKLVTYWVNR